MQIKLTIQFHEQEIPPKCRKPRNVEHEETVKVKIADTTEEEAPVAFVVHQYNESPIKVRSYKGQLYKEVPVVFYNGKECKEYKLEDIPWEKLLKKYTRFGDYTTKSEYMTFLQVTSREYLLVNGVVYKRCYEPYYRIVTFGCSGDGTAIFPEFSDKSRKTVSGYSALDKERAIKDAILIAEGRKDNHCNDDIEKLSQGEISVHAPEFCKRKFKPQI